MRKVATELNGHEGVALSFDRLIPDGQLRVTKEIIGRGANGIVYVGFLKQPSGEEEPVAVKTLAPGATDEEHAMPWRWAEPEHMLLDNVAVAPWAQGRGFGRRLMDHAEARARAAGYDRITLYTHVTMVENIEIYLRRGYVETHRAEVNGLHRVYMAKRLG